MDAAQGVQPQTETLFHALKDLKTGYIFGNPEKLPPESAARLAENAAAHDPEHTMPRRGVDPLDTARYILAARSAIEGKIY